MRRRLVTITVTIIVATMVALISAQTTVLAK
jgi:hypothetical protein